MNCEQDFIDCVEPVETCDAIRYNSCNSTLASCNSGC